MSPSRRLLVRLLLPVLTVVTITAAPATARILSLIRAGDGSGNRHPVEVTIDGSAYGAEVVMVLDSDRVGVFSGASFRVPIGVPTLFAAFGAGTRLTRLGLATGDGDQVSISPHSTAASLVALSPGVLTADDAWLGIVGHLVESPMFPALVRAVEDSTTLSTPQVDAALGDVLESLSPVDAGTCASVCGEWLADTPEVVIENALGTRAVVRSADPSSNQFCGSVAPMDLESDPVAASVGAAAIAGLALEATADQSLVGVPSVTILGGVEDCDGDLTVGTSTGGTRIDETARWLTLIAEHAAPLIDLVAGDDIAPAVSTLEQLAVRRSGRPGEPTVDGALRLVLDEVDGLSSLQRNTVLAVGESVGGGLFGPGPWPSVLEAVIDAAPATTTPVPTSTTSPPTSVLPAPPEAPPARDLAVGGDLSIRYLADQPPRSFMIEVTARNTGEGPVNLAATPWRLVDSATGARLVPTSVSGSLQDGSLAPGSSTSGTLRFTLAKSPAAYSLSWELAPTLQVEAPL